MAKQRRRYDELSLETCTQILHIEEKESGMKKSIAKDAMPEPVVINLESDDDDSLKGTTRENENEICLAMK